MGFDYICREKEFEGGKTPSQCDGGFPKLESIIATRRRIPKAGKCYRNATEVSQSWKASSQRDGGFPKLESVIAMRRRFPKQKKVLL